MAVAPLSLSPSKPQEETELGGRKRCQRRRLCLSQGQALTEPSPQGVSYLRGNVSKMNLKVSQQILHSKEKRPLFFVPKTVDMLAQHPQDQAINLFCFLLLNPNEESWGSRMGPEVLKDGLLAALGLLCEVLCHHLFIIPGVHPLWPAPQGRTRPGSAACCHPLSLLLTQLSVSIVDCAEEPAAIVS